MKGRFLPHEVACEHSLPGMLLIHQAAVSHKQCF